MAQSNSLPIYAIPGMGVDSRIFKELRLDQQIHFLEWEDPFGERESLSDYAQRFARKLPNEPFILLGLSFGGILAQEISRFKPVRGIILLSSIRDESGLPWHMKLMQWVPYYQLSRGNWRIKTMPLWGPFVGLTDPEEIKFLQKVFAEFGVFYRMWAVRT
ncbi:MAG: alpha/beta hydrolase, partial [Bacteroidota bacterium]